ncbi:MAG: outer membrane beta-barrel protein [Balneolaceae bacterium]
MLKRISFFLFLPLSFLLMPGHSIQAQGSLIEKIEVGASLNYNTLHYESEIDVLNDFISFDFGFQIHALINQNISKRFILQSGLEYFFFTYEFEDQIFQQTEPNGGTTGNYYKNSMTENFNTSYLTLPIRIQYHPFSDQQIYFTAGPEFSYKIGYSNGTYKSVLYSDNDERLQESYSDEYDVPESANDFLVSGIAGIGYNLNPVVPIAIEVKAKHSITPYLSGGNYIDSWIRSLSLSVSYKL